MRALVRLPWLRGVALFLGGFAVAGAVAAAAGGDDPARWWIGLRALTGPASPAILAAAGALLAGWALRPETAVWRRVATVAAAAALALVALRDAWTVLALDASGAVHAPGPPLSLAVAAALVAVALAAVRRSSLRPVRSRAVLATAAVAAGLFPLLHIATFGRADYRRPADAIVVYGARTYADGRPSLALADRMRTACALWHEGRAPVLFLSGGPGNGAVHETEAMRRIALAAGVPESALVLDPAGVDTRATSENAAAWLHAAGGARLLAVSHAYHLPRVRLEFDRAGAAAFTVPADESRILGKMPWFVAREAVAWWAACARSAVPRARDA